jgi:uncharacterized SAM-binding protein YcdF (DUF218 family)
MRSGLKRGSERGGIIVNLIVLLFLIVLCALLYFARHPIMRYAAEEWIVDEPAVHADALVVLSDDNFYGDRATHASELFRQGVAPEIVASGRKLRPDAGIGELIEHDLIERGIPKEKIVVYNQEADSTREEAEAVAKLAVARHWKSLVIVTSNYHTRRARYIYEKVMPASVSVSVASARDGEFDPQHWWEKRHSIKLFTREWAGMLEAMWELRNAHPAESKGNSQNSQAIPVFPNGTILHSAVGNPVQKSRLSLYIFVSAVLS